MSHSEDNISDFSSAEEINLETYIDKVALIKSGKRTYIYKCSKQELQNFLVQENITYSPNTSLQDLRKIVSNYIIANQQENLNLLVSKMAVCGEIKQFDGEKWEVFEQQLECFIAVNEISDEKKVPLLITKLTPTVFETLTYLCSPLKPVKSTYEELCKKLKDKYAKSLSTALERAEFRKRNQLPHEKINDYVLELKKLAGRCQFKDMEDQIKEKFIEGVSSKIIKFELMKSEVELSLEKCIEVARTVEAALLHTSSTSEMTEIFYYQKKPKSAPKTKFNSFGGGKQQNMQCFCCGKNNHLKVDCRLKNKYCSECGQQGHLFKMCSSRGKIHTLQTEDLEEQVEEKEESIQNVEEYKTYSFSVSKIPPYYLTVSVNGHDIDFQLDTGSDVTVMSMEDKSKYFNTTELQSCQVMFKNFDQSVTRPLGILRNLIVRMNGICKKLNIFIVKNNAPRVIGRDWLNELKLWPPNIGNSLNIGTNSMLNISDAQQLVKTQFAEVFSPGWGNFKDDVITLKLKPGTKPKCLPVRRVPFALREKVNNEIIRLLNNGRITATEQCEWGTPVVPILKPDGSVRLCGDYKLTVNPCLEIDHFPLPHIDDILDTLKHGEYYCELDLKEAYLQAPLSDDSKSCTTIITEVGTFKYNYLPFGVSSGPGAFQRLMTKRLENIPNTAVFIDNIFIKGKSILDTYKTLSQVLLKLHECEFKLKPEKCKLFTTSLDVFGYRVNKEGISVIQSNIEPLLNAKTPTNLTLLKSFLGKINYYSRFFKKYGYCINTVV